ncbi:MAG: phage holin family protein [Thermoleophilia bacterium]|nr:phage holin family protein [Thermoleophilia bacterium]
MNRAGDATVARERPVPLGDPLLEAEPGRLKSAGPLISAIVEDASTLMRQEVALAKAEVRQSAQQAGKGAGMMAGAAQGAQFALLFLSVALWWALGAGADWGLGWSALVVAVLWGLIAAALALAGKSALRDVGVPRTVETAKKIPTAMKGEEAAL